MLVLLGMLVEQVSAAPAQPPRAVATLTKAPSPAAFKELERATRPYEALSELAKRSEFTELAAKVLVLQVSSASETWRKAQQDEVQAAQAVQQALDNLAGQAYAQARYEWEARTAERDIRVAAHLQALAALALTSPGSSAHKQALLQADAAAAARAAAQRQLELAVATRQKAADSGLAALFQAEDRLYDLESSQDRAAMSLNTAAERWIQLDIDSRELQSRAQVAKTAGWISAGAVAITTDWPLTSSPPWPAPASLTPKSKYTFQGTYYSSSASALAIGDTGRDTLNDRLVQWRDASAWVAMTLAEIGDPTRPGTCGEEGCERWTEEALALAGRRAELQSALAVDQALQAQRIAALEALPAKLRQALVDAGQRQQALASRATRASESLTSLQAAVEQTRQWRTTVDQAHQAAKSTWIKAYARVHGHGFVPEAEGLEQILTDLPPTGAGCDPCGETPPLDKHALFQMRKLQTEPTGFGAYTYVIVTTTGDRNNSGVYRRLLQLTRALNSLPDASKVTGHATRKAANLFVMPVGEERPDPNGMSYDVDMAKQLMVQLPAGWHLPAELKQAMRKGRGPFLMTLPGRLADATGKGHLLFADLSNAPEITVADVVESYKGDLLDGFWSNQVIQWQPRLLQRVALTLVRMVQSTGEVVQSVFPAATAAPLR